MEFPDQFGSDLIPYIGTTTNVGKSSKLLPNRIKGNHVEDVLDTFYAYSKEVLQRLQSLFIVT